MGYNMFMDTDKKERINALKNKITQLNAKQLCIKIFINSVYGLTIVPCI
jgi:DNA polymerase elongation subunit (family B)